MLQMHLLHRMLFCHFYSIIHILCSSSTFLCYYNNTIRNIIIVKSRIVNFHNINLFNFFGASKWVRTINHQPTDYRSAPPSCYSSKFWWTLLVSNQPHLLFRQLHIRLCQESKPLILNFNNIIFKIFAFKSHSCSFMSYT